MPIRLSAASSYMLANCSIRAFTRSPGGSGGSPRAFPGWIAVDRGGGDADPLGDLGALVAEQMHAEQPPGAVVAGHACCDAMGARLCAALGAMKP